MNFDYPPGATPLDPDELDGLRLSHITNRAELDRWEQDNIIEAETWAFRKTKITKDDLLSVKFIRLMHKRMFRNVWKCVFCIIEIPRVAIRNSPLLQRDFPQFCNIEVEGFGTH